MCSTANAVFITVPKYVTITPGVSKNSSGSCSAATLPKIRPAPTATPTGYTSSSSSTCEESNAPKGKKRRLDHLSWEEKIQRKKLKNRVAAQTSRDRKKARMEEMEGELQELSSKTHLLQNKCDSLQIINESLMEKNRKLDMEVETLRLQLQEFQQQQPKTVNVTTCAGCESIINGSAVSNQHTDPLQQGSINLMDSQSAQVEQQRMLRKTKQLAALWRVVAYCLLYKICSPSTCSSTATVSTMKNLMPASWKNLPRACSQISQKTWREAIERAMQLLPKMQAQQSGCLDQWWGPQQQAWNPANIANQKSAVSA